MPNPFRGSPSTLDASAPARRITRHDVESSRHLGKHRWMVERTFAWINQFGCLTIRYEHANLYRGFLVLAEAIIGFQASN